MQTLKGTFWDNGMWVGTVSGSLVGATSPLVVEMLGLTYGDVRTWIIVLALGCLIGHLVGVIALLLKPFDHTKVVPTRNSRRALKWLAVMDVVFMGMLLTVFMLDRTFWVALVGVGVFAVSLTWSLWMLLDDDRWDDGGMLKRGGI